MAEKQLRYFTSGPTERGVVEIGQEFVEMDGQVVEEVTADLLAFFVSSAGDFRDEGEAGGGGKASRRASR